MRDMKPMKSYTSKYHNALNCIGVDACVQMDVYDVWSILIFLPACECVKNNRGSQRNGISILCDQSTLRLGLLLRVIDEPRQARSTQCSDLGDSDDNK